MLPLWASGPGSDNKEGILCIPQSSSITGTLPSDGFLSYPGHSLEESYSSAEKQLVYSTAPNDWAVGECVTDITPRSTLTWSGSIYRTNILETI